MRASKVVGSSTYFQRRNEEYYEFMSSKPPVLEQYFDSRFKMVGGVIKPNEFISANKLADRSTLESYFKQSREVGACLAEQKGDLSVRAHAIKASHQAKVEPSFLGKRPNQLEEPCLSESKTQNGEREMKQQSAFLPMTVESNGNAIHRVERVEPSHRIPSGKASPIAFRKSSKAHEEIELLYDFYTEKFKFTAEELQQNEPVPENCWMHLSCIYWIPEIYLKDNINNIDQRTLTSIGKDRSSTPCIICNTCRGASINCSFEDCEEYFHTECARRAKLYLEIRTTTHARFLIYCPKHTPLLFKNTLHSQEKKAREDISKFHRYFKRFFRHRKILTEQIDIKEKLEEDQMSEISVVDITNNKKIHRGRKEKDKKPEKPEKPQREHLVKYLKYDQKILISALKKKLSSDTNFIFQVTLRIEAEESGYRVTNTNVPTKSIFSHKILKTHPVWREIAQETDRTVNAVYKLYQDSISDLKSWEKNPQAIEPLSKFKGSQLQNTNNQWDEVDEDADAEETNSKLIRIYRGTCLQLQKALGRRTCHR